MFEFPDLKFEKSCNYLENQLQLHNNNKERILDIINNANLDSKKAKNIKSSCYANFVDDANKVLETISNNISSIESLNSKLQSLNIELNSIVAVEPPKTRGKKIYLKTCTDLKDNLIAYSKNFEEMESKLNLDNVYFTEFINKANYSYVTTFNTMEDEFENTHIDIEYSINKDFLKKIHATTSFKFEDISYDENDSSSTSLLFALDDTAEITQTSIQEKSVDLELENDKLLNTLNNLNSGDVLLLSLNIPNDNISNTINENTSPEVIENIEIKEEFVEEIKKLESTIDKELLPEIKNIENLTNLPEESINDKKEKNNVLTPKTILEISTSQKRKIYFKKKLNKKEDITKDSLENKIEDIKNATKDNKTLLISERLGKIYLPYKLSELQEHLEKEPQKYNSIQDVVKEKFTLHFQFFRNQSSKLRFSEAYNLLKNKEKLGFIKSVSYALRISTKKNLNPVIISACRNKHELESYIYYLNSNNLNNFRFFDIIYEVNPLKK